MLEMQFLNGAGKVNSNEPDGIVAAADARLDTIFLRVVREGHAKQGVGHIATALDISDSIVNGFKNRNPELFQSLAERAKNGNLKDEEAEPVAGVAIETADKIGAGVRGEIVDELGLGEQDRELLERTQGKKESEIDDEIYGMLARGEEGMPVADEASRARASNDAAALRRANRERGRRGLPTVQDSERLRAARSARAREAAAKKSAVSREKEKCADIFMRMETAFDTLEGLPQFSAVLEKARLSKEEYCWAVRKAPELSAGFMMKASERAYRMPRSEFSRKKQNAKSDPSGWLLGIVESREIGELLLAISNVRDEPATFDAVAKEIGITEEYAREFVKADPKRYQWYAAVAEKHARGLSDEAVIRFVGKSGPTEAFLEEIIFERTTTILVGVIGGMGETPSNGNISDAMQAKYGVSLSDAFIQKHRNLAIERGDNSIEVAAMNCIWSVPLAKLAQSSGLPGHLDRVRFAAIAGYIEKEIRKTGCTQERTLENSLGMRQKAILDIKRHSREAGEIIETAKAEVVRERIARALVKIRNFGAFANLMRADCAVEKIAAMFGISEEKAKEYAGALGINRRQVYALNNLEQIAPRNGELGINHLLTAMKIRSMLPSAAKVYWPACVDFADALHVLWGIEKIPRVKAGENPNLIVLHYPFLSPDGKEILDAINNLPIGGAILVACPLGAKPDEGALLELADNGFFAKTISVFSKTEVGATGGFWMEQKNNFIMLSKECDGALFGSIPAPFQKDPETAFGFLHPNPRVEEAICAVRDAISIEDEGRTIRYPEWKLGQGYQECSNWKGRETAEERRKELALMERWQEGFGGNNNDTESLREGREKYTLLMKEIVQRHMKQNGNGSNGNGQGLVAFVNGNVEIAGNTQAAGGNGRVPIPAQIKKLQTSLGRQRSFV